MDRVGAYLIGVTAAALLCALVTKMGFGHLTGAMIKMVCGVFMAMAVVAPWSTLRLQDATDFVVKIQDSGADLAAQGEKTARDAMANIISGRTQTYILEKAASLDLKLAVEVSLSDEEIPIPIGVTLRGTASPYGREVLGEYIRTELGISEEAQIWIS